MVSPVLSELARDLWLWCTERYILIQTQHLSGSVNSTADRPDRSDWKLNPTIIQKIHPLLEPLSIHPLASSLLAQLPSYISWKPNTLALGTDAFSHFFKDRIL